VNAVYALAAEVYHAQAPLVCRCPLCSGPGSVVDVGTGYGLDGPGIESRWE